MEALRQVLEPLLTDSQIIMTPGISIQLIKISLDKRDPPRLKRPFKMLNLSKLCRQVVTISLLKNKE